MVSLCVPFCSWSRFSCCPFPLSFLPLCVRFCSPPPRSALLRPVPAPSFLFPPSFSSLPLLPASSVLAFPAADFAFLPLPPFFLAPARSRARRCVASLFSFPLSFFFSPLFPSPFSFLSSVLSSSVP
ncbi:hypothetical protein F8C09_24605, partial [Escherichia coli]|nr:hypothetical protein [Escherichia coli]